MFFDTLCVFFCFVFFKFLVFEAGFYVNKDAYTRSSLTADGPRDAPLWRSKCCQLLHNRRRNKLHNKSTLSPGFRTQFQKEVPLFRELPEFLQSTLCMIYIVGGSLHAEKPLDPSSRFYCAMLCIRGTSHGPVSVCDCVCLSVTSRCSTKAAKRRITQTTPHDRSRLGRVMVECTLFMTHCLRLNLQLHTISLVRTCRISSFCTVAWQLAR